MIDASKGLLPMTVENIFTSDWGCGMNEANEQPATPVQLALCRLLDGAPLGLLAEHPHVVRAFGCALPDLMTALRRLMVVAAIRSAKSMMMSAKAISVARTGYVGRPVRPSDSLRVPIVSPEIDTSKATFAHVMGILENSDLLRPLILKSTADSVTIEHETGRPVEIKVVALAAYGKTLVGRWLPSIIWEEIFLMGSGEYVKNLTDARDAIHGRILPGGIEMMVGSAKGSIGPAFELHEKHFGAPSTAFIVCKAEGPLMNPVTYTPEHCEELERDNERAYNENVLCLFSEPEQAFISRLEIQAAQREASGEVKPEKGWNYVAAMDPATRGHAWAFGILGGRPDGGLSLVVNREWRPRKGKRLDPKVILAEIADLYREYGCTMLVTDQNMAEALQSMAIDLGMAVIVEDLTGENRLKMAEDFIALLRGGLFDIPQDDQLMADLLWIRRRVSSNGVPSLSIPETPNGRHCDYVPVLMLGTKWKPSEPDAEVVEREEEPLEEWIENQGDQHERYLQACRTVAA